ncbi:MAG: signal peptidase I [Beutenbergiaceae bacterium]
MGRPRRLIHHLVRWVSWLVLAAASLALVAGVFVPVFAGAKPYTVLTGSMSPGLPPGTLVVVKPVPFDDIVVGDVITYQLRSGEPEVATHRVVGYAVSMTGEPQLVTRGDANSAVDPAPVLPVQVRGRVWYAIPYLGLVGTILPAGVRQAGTYLLAGLLAGYATFMFISAVRDRLKRRRAEAEPGRVNRSVPCTVAVTTVLVALCAAPAAAADELAFSWDGLTWDTQLDAPLFDPSVHWVPGDVRTASFWVRNRGESAAALTIMVASHGIADLMAQGDLRFTVKVGDGAWVGLADATGSTLPGQIAVGASEPVHLRATFDPAAGNGSQMRQLEFQISVVLSAYLPPTGTPEPDATAGGGAAAAGNDGTLAVSGVRSGELLALAAALVALGVAHRRLGRA